MILAACEGCRTVKLDPESARITDQNREEFARLDIFYNPHRIAVYCDVCHRWRQFIMFDPTVGSSSPAAEADGFGTGKPSTVPRGKATAPTEGLPHTCVCGGDRSKNIYCRAHPNTYCDCICHKGATTKYECHCCSGKINGG